MLKRYIGVLLGVLLITLSGWSQGLFATLTGVVADPSGSVIANADVKLQNSESGDVRTTKTTAEGYYTFSSVPVGSYNLTVDAPGFQQFKVTTIALTGAEKRNINAS